MPENVPDTPSTLAQLVADGRGAPCRPWPRSVVPRKTWLRAADHLATAELTLLALWGEPDLVHMALADGEGDIAVLSHAPTAGRFPSVARRHPPAARPERAVRDVYGLTPDGASDRRPWLDHGRWEVTSPLGDATPRRGAGPYDYRFLPAEGEALHEIPVGPVHAGIIEPGHFRFTAGGETVVRLEERLGYVHRGIEGLMAGAELEKAARLAGRVSGDSTVAYAIAFARAVEAALGLEAPPRAAYLRAVMAEIERVANHLGDIAVLSHAPTAGRFPSVARRHPPAARPERAVRDLYGLTPDGASDRRPWLDHGRWEVTSPLGDATPRRGAGPYDYRFLPAEGEALHEIPVGPVHAGIIEPGHFRFTAGGETVVRLEARLGYVHRGIEGLLAGADLVKAARLAGRVSGDSTVAYAIAFARAVEAALGLEAPPRAVYLRAVMAEIERIANHLGDIGAVANDAAFALLHAHCAVLRERVLRAADACFGHRLMMDKVVPGGVAADLSPEGVALLRETIAHLGRRFPHLVTLYEGTASLQDRTVGTGTVSPSWVRRFGAGGFVGRASGRREDARLRPGYPPYHDHPPALALRTDGDVNARVWVRIDEVLESVRLLEALLEALPDGPLRARTEPADDAPGEGLAMVEGFRGDVLAWVRLSPDGRVDRAHLRDPSWFQWPLLEAAIEGNIVADFPLCNKSFNCSYAGHDL